MFLVSCLDYKDLMLEQKNPKFKKYESKYHTGRWTHAENKKFMEGLQKYGRNWVLVQKRIKTRSLAQIRSHAQKMFLNMQDRDIDAMIGYDNSQQSSMPKGKKKKLNFSSCTNIKQYETVDIKPQKLESAAVIELQNQQPLVIQASVQDNQLEAVHQNCRKNPRNQQIRKTPIDNPYFPISYLPNPQPTMITSSINSPITLIPIFWSPTTQSQSILFYNFQQ